MRTQVYLLTLAVLAPATFGPGAGGDPARDAVDRVRTKVIVLKTSRAAARASANGFLVRPGLLLTASHVVAGVDSVTAWVNGVSYPARTAALHPDFDLALVDFSAPRLLLKPVELAPTSETLKPEEPLLILTGPSQAARAHGDPAGRLPLPASFHIRVSVPNAAGRFHSMLKLNASVRMGDSGSPVIRVQDGAVVGTLCSRQAPDAGGVSHFAYAAPVEAVHAWMEEVLRARPTGREKAGDFYLFGVGR